MNFLVVIDIMLGTARTARLQMGEGHAILVLRVGCKKAEQAGAKLVQLGHLGRVGKVGSAGE
jgi:hypothetical protein